VTIAPSDPARRPALVGVVLAGGRSERFGSADKLAADFRGMPLLHHAVLHLAEVCPLVVVVAAAGGSDPQLPPGAPVVVARDAAPGQGPLSGLLGGLTEAAGADLLLVAGGDMPDLRTPVLLEMLKVAAEADVDAVALQDGPRISPLPCVLRASAAAGAAHALLHDGERSLRALLQALRTAVVDEATWTALDPERGTLFDVDLPEHLIR
jgi:molybdopterin-guanine dinucleotide biosynthesis protein A